MTPRQRVEKFLGEGCWIEAQHALADLWQDQPSAATAAYVLDRMPLLRKHLPFKSCRVAILRSFTVEPLVPLLRAAASINGIELTVHVGGFNTYVQEMLDGDSALYRFSPEIVILAVQTRDLFPELWLRYPDLSDPEVEAVLARAHSDIESWVSTFRSHNDAHLVLHSFEMPDFPSQGLFDQHDDVGQVAAILRLNQGLARIAEHHRGVYLLDYDAVIARHGRVRWHDERKWLTMRMPIVADHLIHLAEEWLRFVYPLSGKICKALVTDLDNTLWGGVIGEDGIDGIQLGIDYPGAAFQALQRVMLDFYRRGILLAVCSKNNLSDAMEVLEKHPGMLLKPEHFAAFRINWTDKAHNLREIATELNIGLDALAFLDDNPVERERIRTELPEVNVVDLPADPMDYALALRKIPAFERLSLTEEDRERGRYYAEQRQRVQLEQSAASLEDFYRSLRQEMEISTVTPGTLTRVAQLTQKTNQFNLTTRRYSEQQIAAMAASPEWQVYLLRVRDRFGDNGIVGVAITHDTGEICEIDTFLMSCRVIGRTVESAFLTFLVDQARARGRTQIQGWFLPTNKNIDLVKEFYPHHGFKNIAGKDGGSLWSLELSAAETAVPAWIQLTLTESALAQ